jgi:hypothetical protein
MIATAGSEHTVWLPATCVGNGRLCCRRNEESGNKSRALFSSRLGGATW